MCYVLVIAGKTGAGKTTITECIGKKYNCVTLSFAEMVKQFAKQQGHKRLRNCYKMMNREEFVSALTSYIKSVSLNTVIDNNVVVIDGLYSYDVIQELRKNSNTIVIYIRVNKEIRYSRIAKRIGTNIAQTIEEDNTKEEIKIALGNDRIIEAADYIIDGNRPIELVMQDVYDILNNWEIHI